jgi:hypothetical protein
VAHHVVGGVLQAVVEVVVEQRLQRRIAHVLHLFVAGHLALVELQAGVDRGLDARLVFFGHAHQHAHHPHRHEGGERGHEVEPVDAAVLHLGERLGAELADLGLEAGHLLGGEHSGEDAAMGIVRGRVFEDEHARGHLDVGLDELGSCPWRS